MENAAMEPRILSSKSFHRIIQHYIRKAYYYQNYGVREYWIVNPKRRMVTVNYFEGDIINVTYSFASTVKVNIYHDLWIDFSQIEQLL